MKTLLLRIEPRVDPEIREYLIEILRKVWNLCLFSYVCLVHHIYHSYDECDIDDYLDREQEESEESDHPHEE